MPKDLSHSPYRWILEKKDTRSLYRQYHRLQGVKIIEKDHLNLHEWLNPDSPQFNKELRDAVFHYSPRTSRDDRLAVCISTAEMKEAAWKYAHHSQIILDGTFGICDKKMLLFIAMGVDSANRGVPLAFFLFSAPSKNQHTSAGYDAAILEEMLENWKRSMGSRNGEEFAPWVAITDTDLAERNALTRAFPSIWLLICKFHLRQSWRNHLNSSVNGKSRAHAELRTRLCRLEEELVETESFEAAKALVAAEASIMEDTKNEYEDSLIKGVQEHLDYLKKYWLREFLWQSWSRSGRIRAAEILNRPVNDVLPTTNHLESFNGVLKRKHLGRWKHGGRRLRLDILIQVLVFRALPSIFKQRNIEDCETARRERMLRRLPGGDQIVDGRTQRSASLPSEPLAWLVVDTERDAAAMELVKNSQISVPTIDSSGGYTFTCYSALATTLDTNPTLYTVRFANDSYGSASCTCKDFQSRGGACKHMRAAILQVEVLRALKPELSRLPPIQLPPSEAIARSLHSQKPDPITQASLAIDDIIQEAPRNPEDISAGLMPIDDLDNELVDIVDEAQTTDYESEALDIDDAVSELTDADALELARPTADHNLEYTELQFRNQQALNEQTIARTLHDLEKISPKLAQIGEWLANVHLNCDAEQDIERAKTIRSSLGQVTYQLERMLIEVGQPSRPSNSSSQSFDSNVRPVTPPPTFTRSAKSGPLNIIGPSPERKAQKRKQSYAVH